MSESLKKNYSAIKYSNNSSPFENESNLDENDLLRMNQDLNELINAFNKSNSFSNNEAKSSKTQTLLNLDLTDLNELESITNDERDETENEEASYDDERSPKSRTQNPLDHNSSTMEFRKYLEDLKKNYLEKLTFSCPPKLQPQQQSSMATSRSTNTNWQNSKLKSTDNVGKFDSARRSLFCDSAAVEGNKNCNNLNKSSSSLVKNESLNDFRDGYSAGASGLVETVSYKISKLSPI